MELNYNRVELRGVAEDAPLLSHVNHGCAFYRFTLSPRSCETQSGARS